MLLFRCIPAHRGSRHFLVDIWFAQLCRAVTYTYVPPHRPRNYNKSGETGSSFSQLLQPNLRRLLNIPANPLPLRRRPNESVDSKPFHLPLLDPKLDLRIRRAFAFGRLERRLVFTIPVGEQKRTVQIEHVPLLVHEPQVRDPDGGDRRVEFGRRAVVDAIKGGQGVEDSGALRGGCRCGGAEGEGTVSGVVVVPGVGSEGERHS